MSKRATIEADRLPTADVKQKLADVAQKEKAAAAEAAQLEKNAAAEAAKKKALEVTATKAAERRAKAAQKQAIVPSTTEAEVARLKRNAEALANEPEEEDDMDQGSAHDFHDPKEDELWDALGITEALWKRAASATEAIAGEFIPSSIEEKSAEWMTKLRELQEKDRKESLKITSFREKVEAETDEDFTAQISAHLDKLITENNVT